MTREQLAAENARLREENAGLRDLLAAVSLAAGTAPICAAGEPEWKELRRASRVLSVIKNAASLSDWDGYLAWAAGEVRETAAEDPGYKVYVPAQAVTGTGAAA